MRTGTTLFRCGGQEYPLVRSTRDVHLLDGEYFFHRWDYRRIFGLDFLAGFPAPPLGKVLLTHKRGNLIIELTGLLNALENQRDLISYSYQYVFTDRPRERHGGGMSGFRVGGLYGLITTRPAGYCHVTLSEAAPTGCGRLVHIIDMRIKKQLQTDDRGTLKILRRKANVGWFPQLPLLIDWLTSQTADEVDVLHA